MTDTDEPGQADEQQAGLPAAAVDGDDTQAAVDAADTAAGYVSVLDEQDATTLPDTDPNVSGGPGPFDHLNHIGDPVPDGEDDGVAAIGAQIDAGQVQ